LIYIYPSDDSRNIKLSIEYALKVIKGQESNMIVSGFKQSAATIAEMIRGGLYEIVQ
jgi:hypothetical protein